MCTDERKEKVNKKIWKRIRITNIIQEISNQYIHSNTNDYTRTLTCGCCCWCVRVLGEMTRPCAAGRVGRMHRLHMPAWRDERHKSDRWPSGEASKALQQSWRRNLRLSHITDLHINVSYCHIDDESHLHRHHQSQVKHNKSSSGDMEFFTREYM